MSSWMLTIACCLAVGLRLRLDLVSGSLVVMHTYLYYFRLSLSHCLCVVGSCTTVWAKLQVATFDVTFLWWWKLLNKRCCIWTTWRHFASVGGGDIVCVCVMLDWQDCVKWQMTWRHTRTQLCVRQQLHRPSQSRLQSQQSERSLASQQLPLLPLWLIHRSVP